MSRYLKDFLNLYEFLRSVGLTEPQAKIGFLINCGMKNKDIAERLFVSPKTITWHINIIYRKLNVKNRKEFLRKIVTDYHGKLD